MNIIFLIGMPFAGKTYWAKKLSENYRVPYVDMDDMIEKAQGKTVSEIFETDGEANFRLLEHQLLATIIDSYQRPLIVSCGGGTPVFYDNMQLMNNAGCTVFLDAGIATLVDHFEQKEDTNERPLLASVSDIHGELQLLFEKRKNIYKQAHYILHSEQISITNFDKIFSLCISSR
ncbi:MAG: shikimate kinase [Bacteroidetes bacterium]|nr:shikimate kinase [Bacteroidota bacterium]